ncbi:MAG: histidine kinase [Lachnospiraceae bacterium]
MKRTKLQTRFFLTYFILTLSLVGVFSLFFYQYTSSILIKQEIKSITDLTSSIMTQTETMIQDMDRVSINIGYSNLIKDRLGSAFNLKVSNDSFQSLADLFVSINGADVKVDQINLYDFNGNAISVGLSSKTHKVPYNDLTWMKQTRTLAGAKNLSSPYQSAALSGSTKVPHWYISLYRTYFNRYGAEVGAIETIKNCKSVFKSIPSHLQKTTPAPQVYIYSQTGELLYPYGLPDEQAQALHHYYTVLEASQNHLSLRNPQNNTKELIAYEVSPYTAWTYVTVQKESVVLRPVTNLSNLLIWIVLIIVLLSVLVSYYLSMTLIRPIRQLQNVICKTRLNTLGSLPSDAIANSFDELADLENAFYDMSKNLNHSMDALIETKQQELKSRSLALQSQINPHFYYNTLASIIVLTEEQQSEQVIDLCRSLSKIMRYITSSESSIVTIEKEIDYIEKYLHCMKFRYQSSLNYEITIDSSLINIMIPKLLIQPFVENALKYGTDCLPPWNIKIYSTITETEWTISILDSGNGFTDKALDNIQTHITNSQNQNGIPDIQIDGLGILNVYSRWKLYCGEEMIFSVGNTADGHGIVTIGRKTDG